MIYLLRHGEDDESYVGGWSDIDLTTMGIKQIKEVAKFIKDNGLDIRKIYSSDIKRAVTTSEIISNEIGIKPQYTTSLRELNKGILTGLKTEEAIKIYPKYFGDLDIYTRYPNGESMMDLYYRIKEYYDKFIDDDNTLLITHRGVINMIYFLSNNMLPDMDKKKFMVTHGSLHELDREKRKIKRLRG